MNEYSPYMDIHNFLAIRDEKIPVLDVRSPSEFASGHIHNAISFPLFSDEERALIGISYKKEGRKKAIKQGLGIVGPKMQEMIEEAERLRSQEIALYCWRGGMRSSSVGWLLKQYGFDIHLLRGGYKSYRRELFALFEKPLHLKVLTGYTGSGKTEILREMKRLGEQVVDLESLANHPGSSFGNQVSTWQPTSEQFQNHLFEEIRTLDLNRTIWIEDESICIGNCVLPDAFFEQKTRSEHILVKTPMRRRVEFLVANYGYLSAEQLKKATWMISKKLGGKETEEAIKNIEAGDFYEAAGIILTYYDRQYRKALEKKSNWVSHTLAFEHETFEEIAKKIVYVSEAHIV
jgi:tRNA 2-selenouridine synthase